jgi:hypothetical protein
MKQFVFALVLPLIFLFACGARAEPFVQCKSGLTCPAGMACLANGLCARVEAAGCFPGEQPSYASGLCLPEGFVDCGARGWCRPGQRCGRGYTCVDGSPNKGPLCGGEGRCPTGAICDPDPYNPTHCLDPERQKHCGHNICSIHAICGESDECLRIVGDEVAQTKAPEAKEEGLAENPEEALARKIWFSRPGQPSKTPDDKTQKSYPIGAVGALSGEAYWVWPDGKKTPVRAGEPAIFGNRIVTGPDGRVQLLLLDNTVFTAGPNSDMKIDEFVYDPSGTQNTLVARIEKGIFRWVDGELDRIARRERDYEIKHGVPEDLLTPLPGSKVDLPVGTIGFRGTEVECKVDPDGSGYLKVLSGEVTFTNTRGEKTDLKEGQTFTFEPSKPQQQVVPETTSAEDVVRQFYAALHNGQGDVASQLVVPEKRATGPFSADQLSQFYGHLNEPIALVDLAARGQDEFLVRYHYASSKLQCDGRAIVDTISRDGQNYIQSIKALNGC